MADLSLNFNRQAMARRLGFGGSSLDSTTAMRAFLNTAHAANATRKDLNTEFYLRSQWNNAVLADSPIGYWRLGETGTTFVDTGSGAKNATGTVTTSVASPIYDGNTAITLSGAQSLATAVTDPLAAATACSVECWVNANGAWSVGSTNILVNPGNAGHYIAIGTGSQPIVSLIISGVQRLLNTAPALSATGWHHLVATWASGDLIRLYVDGVLSVASSAFAGTLDASTGGVCLGAFNTAAPSLFFTGSLDEAAIFTTQLSATQVATHYAGR
jgi:hypothetical protein